MVDETLKPALRLALRLHEIGDSSPYQLSFAGKGNSGASFGFMQGDMNGGQPEVQQTFHDVLAAAGMDDGSITGFARQLSTHLVACPLSNSDRDAINAALLASSALVDAMDEQILGKVYVDLDACTTRATASNRTIAPKALIYMALWINMTGYPNMLLTWLGGGTPALSRPVPPAGAVVDGPAMEAYFAGTDYFIKNPQNMPQMLQCSAAGAVTLGAGP